METAKLFAAVREALAPSEYQKVSQLLLDGDLAISTHSPSSGHVDQILPSLKARLVNSRRSDTTIYGLAETIRRFEQLPPDAVVNGYAVNGSNAAGVIYLNGKDKEGIGVVLVDILSSASK